MEKVQPRDISLELKVMPKEKGLAKKYKFNQEELKLCQNIKVQPKNISLTM